MCERRKSLAQILLLDQGWCNKILIWASRYAITKWRRTNATQQTRNQICIYIYLIIIISEKSGKFVNKQGIKIASTQEIDTNNQYLQHRLLFCRINVKYNKTNINSSNILQTSILILKKKFTRELIFSTGLTSEWLFRIWSR